MNQRQLAAALFAVIGIFMAATRLPDLLLHASIVAQWDPAMEDPTSPVPQRSMSIFAFVAHLMGVLIGLLLVMLREKIASLLFSSPSGQIEAPDVQAVALSVLGCYFVIHGIHEMMMFGAFRWAGAVQALLGLGLFLGARGVAGLWSNLRAAAGPVPYE